MPAKTRRKTREPFGRIDVAVPLVKAFNTLPVEKTQWQPPRPEQTETCGFAHEISVCSGFVLGAARLSRASRRKTCAHRACR